MLCKKEFNKEKHKILNQIIFDCDLSVSLYFNFFKFEKDMFISEKKMPHKKFILLFVSKTHLKHLHNLCTLSQYLFYSISRMVITHSIEQMQSQIISRSNILRHQFYLPKVIIQVQNGNGGNRLHCKYVHFFYIGKAMKCS